MANQGTWQAGGVSDFIYMFGYFLMTMGLIQLKTVSDSLAGKKD